MKDLSALAAFRGVHHCFIASPLETDQPEALLFPDVQICVSLSDVKGAVSLSVGGESEKKDSSVFLSETHKKYQDAAIEAFQTAAEAHFAMESIYTSAMNFDFLDNLSERLIREIRQKYQ